MNQKTGISFKQQPGCPFSILLRRLLQGVIKQALSSFMHIGRQTLEDYPRTLRVAPHNITKGCSRSE
jgi:hypothetical protein